MKESFQTIMEPKVQEELDWFKREILPKIIDSDTGLSAKHKSAVEVLNVELKFIGVEEAFMLTSCYRIILHYRLQTSGSSASTVLVVKKTPAVPQDMYDNIGFGRLFNNEIITYNCILQSMEAFTKNSFTAPKYCYSELRNGFGIIVLEDFGTDGWQLCETKYNLSLEHVILAVKYLANFHGIGFAMKACDASNFGALTEQLQEARYFSNTTHCDFNQQIISSRKRLQMAVQKYQPQIGSDFMNKLLTMLKNYMEYCQARMVPHEPLATICHGDYLRNNLAFRYGNVNGKHQPTEVMMFDFQTMRLSSPMVDLSVLLSLSAFAEVRYQHFEHIFKTYCETLSSTFEKYAKTPVPEHLRQDALLREYTAFLPYSISIASYFLLQLVQPFEASTEDFLMMERTAQEIEADMLTRGGDVVDRELAHQALEMYELSSRLHVDLSKAFQCT